MREIKFRGLHRNSGNMCFSDILGLGKFFSDVESDDIELRGEYTGLKDKNGKEIYEGDIIKRYREGDMKEFELCEVGWHIGRCMFDLSGTSFYYGHPDKSDEWRYEIIGNIYENPELLNV